MSACSQVCGRKVRTFTSPSTTRLPLTCINSQPTASGAVETSSKFGDQIGTLLSPVNRTDLLAYIQQAQAHLNSLVPPRSPPTPFAFDWVTFHRIPKENGVDDTQGDAPGPEEAVKGGKTKYPDLVDETGEWKERYAKYVSDARATGRGILCSRETFFTDMGQLLR